MKKPKAKKAATQRKPRKRHEKRDLAKILFVVNGMSAVEVARTLDIQPKTIGEWRREDNWDEERTMRNVSPVQLIKRFNEEINGILDAITLRSQTKPTKGDATATGRMTAAEADMIAKLTKGIKNLRNSIDPQTVMEVLHGFTSYLSIAELDLAQKITGHCMLYVQSKLKEGKDKG